MGNLSDGPPRRCVECGSYKTKKHIRLGRRNWYIVGDIESAGGLYQCNNCYNRHRLLLQKGTPIGIKRRNRATALRRARKKALKESKTETKVKAKAKAKVRTTTQKVHARRLRPAPKLTDISGCPINMNGKSSQSPVYA
jgi:hypothetical protein